MKNFASRSSRASRSMPRTLPCKFFYDERGSALFQKSASCPSITSPARRCGFCASAAARWRGARPRDRIDRPRHRRGNENANAPWIISRGRSPIVPVDISREQLTQSAHCFSQKFPALEILPVCADYLQPFELPRRCRKPTRTVVYFPGSTIGNLEPDDARRIFCAEDRRACAGAQRRLAHRRRSEKIESDSRTRLQRQRGRDGAVQSQTCSRGPIANSARISICAAGIIAPFTMRRPGASKCISISEASKPCTLATMLSASRPAKKSSLNFPTNIRLAEMIALAGYALVLRFEKVWTDEQKLFGAFCLPR